MEQKFGDSSSGERFRRCPAAYVGDSCEILDKYAGIRFKDATLVVPTREARDCIHKLREDKRIGRRSCCSRGTVRLKKPGRVFDQAQRSVGCHHKQL